MAKRKTATKKTAPKKTVKKKNPGKHPGGRPTKYKESYPEQARKLCLLGYTDIQLADFFEVAESTVSLWKLEHPKFSEALKNGKEVADGEVAASFFQRAKGYSHPDTHISNYQGEITETPIIKHYPPDTAAAFIWLKNRQPKIWRDKQELEISGETTQIQIYELPSNGREPDPTPEPDETD